MDVYGTRPALSNTALRHITFGNPRRDFEDHRVPRKQPPSLEEISATALLILIVA